MFKAVGRSDLKFLSINIIRRTTTDKVALFFSFTRKKGYKDEKKEVFVTTEVFNSKLFYVIY